jgi:cyanophycinase-like exopeptidase
MFFSAYDLRSTIVPDHSNDGSAAFDSQGGRRLLSRRKPTTLIAGKFGSRHFGTKPYLAEAVSLTGKDNPVALYIGAASADDRGFGTALAALLKAAGVRRVLWPKLSKGKEKDASGARAALDEADLVFVGGGDVEAGVQALRDADLVDELHAAAKRGVVFVGMSAGAIMLGERWIRWPREGASDDEAETYECLGIAPCSLDTHGEGDRWQETQSFAAVRARELGKKARAYGVPSGAALVIQADGSLQARGDAVTVFAALPNRKAKVETQLEADE